VPARTPSQRVARQRTQHAARTQPSISAAGPFEAVGRQLEATRPRVDEVTRSLERSADYVEAATGADAAFGVPHPSW